MRNAARVADSAGIWRLVPPGRTKAVADSAGIRCPADREIALAVVIVVNMVADLAAMYDAEAVELQEAG